MNMKKLLALVLALLMVLAFTACAKEGAPSSAAPASSDAAPASSEDAAPASSEDAEPASSEDAAPSDGSKKQVSIIYNSSFGDQSKCDAAGLWPDYEVEWISYAENDLDSKILLEMVSGSKSFDMACTQASGAKQYGSMGLLEPLEPLDDWDDIFQGNRDQHSIGDTIYGYPMIGDAYILMYNTELFEKAGLTEPPKTFDEFYEYAQKLTIDANGKNATEDGFDPSNVVQWGTSYLGGTGNGNCWEFCCLAYSNGGLFITKDFTNMTYEVTCDSEPMIKSMQFLLDLYNNGLMPTGTISYDYDEYKESFYNESVAMTLQWPGHFAQANGTAAEGKLACAGIPTGDAGIGSGPMGGWSINVFKDAPHKEDALAWAKIYASPAGIDAFEEASGTQHMIPRASFFEKRIKAAQDAGDDATVNYLQAVQASAEVCQATDIAQTDACASDTQEIASRYINKILSGEYSAEDGMKAMKAELETALADGGYMQ